MRELLDEIVLRGAPIMANRTLALVRKICNSAIESEWLESNPCHMIKRPAPDRQRQRVLNEDEVRAVWKALDEEHDHCIPFRIRPLTAQRGSKVHGASWDEMDLDQKRSAPDFWGRRLEAIIANKRGAKVLTFEARC